MSKFMILYSSDATARETMAGATPEEMQAAMAEWIEWQKETSKTFKVEFGMPLQAVGEVTTSGIGDSNSQISGYMTAEADSKEVVLDKLKSHPHLKRGGSSIDVFELLSMPGIEA